jgi:hypothetical protein
VLLVGVIGSVGGWTWTWVDVDVGAVDVGPVGVGAVDAVDVGTWVLGRGALLVVHSLMEEEK